MPVKYRYYTREFLNSKHHGSSAHMILAVEDTTDKEETKWSDIEFTIADCSRIVSLEFDISSKEARQNSLYKLVRLKTAVDRFSAALREEMVLADLREKASDAAKEEE